MTDRAIKLQCPACQRHLKIPRLNPKKAIVCPKCNGRFRIDAQQQAYVDTGRKGWFGPLTNRVVLNDTKLTPPNEIRGAFEDIDHLLAGDKSTDRSPSPKSDGSNRKTSVTQASSEAAEASLTAKGTGSNQTRGQDSGERWAQEKSAMSKSDERFQRNGLGLLVLATGLALLPFVGLHVEGLQTILPYMPLTSAGLAFIGSFMLACSLRRGNLAAVLFSGLPFLLIGLVGLGGYFYQSAVVVKNAVDQLVPANGPEILNPVGDQEFESDKSDVMDVDLNSIDNNAASNFVPPRHEQPLAAGKKPALAPAPDDSVNTEPEHRLAAEKTTDREPEAQRFKAEASGDSAIAAELKSALEISLNAEKLDRLRDRIASEMTRGHVNRQNIVSPVELRERFDLTEVAGESTVYGVAYFLPDPIRGFDVAFSADRSNRTLELIVPVIDQPEFGDSIVPVEMGSVMIGLNVNVQPPGVVGLQGLFFNDGRQQKSSSKWAGQKPRDNTTATIESAGRRIHGIVVYRNQLKVAGVALILEKQAELPN